MALTEEFGMKMNEDRTIGYFEDPHASPQLEHFFELCGRMEAPVLMVTFTQEQLEKLQKYKRKIMTDEEPDEYQHDLVLIGQKWTGGFRQTFSAQRLAEILSVLGLGNVTFYQDREGPICIKTEKGKAFLAPIQWVRFYDSSTIPYLQELIVSKENPK